MLFSFLVPVYNVERYVRQCVESLLVQNGAEFEIVLLNDGSTDSSGTICDEYAQRYPAVIRVIHKQNEGLLLTRRRGFKEAKGDWFICVDSDDYVAPDLLSTVVEEIKKHNCDMLMYNFDYVDNTGRHTPSRVDLHNNDVFEGERKQTIYEQKLLSVNINSMWMRVIHRNIVDIDADYSKIGIRNMCEDAVQMLQIYTNARKIVYINKVLYHYRKTETSITGSMDMIKWNAMHTTAAITSQYMEKWGVSDQIKRRFATKQIEAVCNCLRWYYSNESDRRQERQNELKRIKKVSSFYTFAEDYDKTLSSTKYCRLSVPILMCFIAAEKELALKCWFKFEKKMRG